MTTSRVKEENIFEKVTGWISLMPIHRADCKIQKGVTILLIKKKKKGKHSKLLKK